MEPFDCLVHFNVDYLDYLPDSKISEIGFFVHSILDCADGLLHLEDFDGKHDFFGFFESQRFDVSLITEEIKHRFGVDIGRAFTCSL